ncbi:aconitase X catalytic domain-containing protein [Methanimicrococcus sp. OttesenSCG-928-J09]|nr:aconitase X catalytic domain-containing protein [Methanimicrococcus sp. OttesenSCG-928-J09]
MYLTKEEEKTLRGEDGETLQKAIEILVALGDIYGADALIPIKSAQVSGVSYKTIGDAGIEWISDLKGTVKVPTVLNPAGMDMDNWERLGIDPKFAAKQIEIINAFGSLGIEPKCTCTPYYLSGFDVQYKDHLAWGESSAISFSNSVLGARTNREGGPSALSAALVGKTADYGFHKTENRTPNIEITVDFETAGSDYGALGYIAGKIVGSKIPLFKIKSVPSKDEMKMLGAAMAASGAVALYHIDGVTPEITDKEFVYEKPAESVSIEKKDIDAVYESANESTMANDIVTIGCPHCSKAELAQIADLLEGKTVVKEFWVFTSRELAGQNKDLVDRIEASGAKVVCDTCMVVSPAANKYQCMMVNSGKAYAYVPSMCGSKATYGTVERCVKDATGEI